MAKAKSSVKYTNPTAAKLAGITRTSGNFEEAPAPPAITPNASSPRARRGQLAAGPRVTVTNPKQAGKEQ